MWGSICHLVAVDLGLGETCNGCLRTVSQHNLSSDHRVVLICVWLGVSVKHTSAPCHLYPSECTVNSTLKDSQLVFLCYHLQASIWVQCRWQVVYWLDLDNEH